MSRLAHLLTQLATTSHTQDKLAATYFDPPTPRSALPPPRQRLGVLVGVAVLGMCIGCAISSVRRRSMTSRLPPAAPAYAVLGFDDANAWESLGQRFGAWWGRPGAPHQSLILSLDQDTYAGSAGQSLRIDYALPDQPERSPPLGVWFTLPDPALAEPYQLEFWIRGDARVGYTERATLELRSESLSEQRALTIGSAWAPVRIPMALQTTPNGRTQRWNECRILFDQDRVTVTRGRIYIDQIRLTAPAP